MNELSLGTWQRIAHGAVYAMTQGNYPYKCDIHQGDICNDGRCLQEYPNKLLQVSAPSADKLLEWAQGSNGDYN